MARRATITIDVLDRASPQLARIRQGMQLLGATAAAVGAYQLGRLFVDGVQAAVAAAGVQERAEQSLAQALANTGQSVAATLPGMKAYASELQRQTGIGDELILKNQQLLVSIGRLSGEGLQRATRAAIDLSVATDRDLRTSFELLAKAAAGETSQLKRYGIILDESLPAAERFDAALRQIEQTMGGQASATMQTFEGQVQALNNAVGDLAEALGDPLREVGEAFLRDVLRPLVEDMTDAASGSESLREGILRVGIALADVGTVGEAFVRKAGGPLAAVMRDQLARAKGAAFGLELLLAGLTAVPLTSGAATLALRELNQTAAEGDLYFKAFGDSLRQALAEGPGGGSGARIQEALATWRAEQQKLLEVIARYRPELEAIAIGLGEENDLLEVTEASLLRQQASWDTINAAIAAATDAAAGLGLEMADSVEPPIERLGRTIERVFTEESVRASLTFTDTLVQAAFGADVAWSQFFRQLLADMASAIAQALVFRAIMTAVSGGTFAFFGSQGGRVPGQAWRRAAMGTYVPGPQNRGDVVPAMLRPGEIVLNQDQARNLAGRQPGGPMTVRVELGPNLRQIATAVSVEVERGGTRLVATELAGSRYRRVG